MRSRITRRAAPALLLASCLYADPTPPAGEGEVCTGVHGCATGLDCVEDVGDDYGRAAEADICESPRVAYVFLHRGDRGEDGRVDAALERIEGIFRLPRMSSSDPPLATVAQPLLARDGYPLTCAGLDGAEQDCQVPDWPRYYGDQLGRYDRFILFGLRLYGDLLYTAREASDRRLRSRLTARTGGTPSARELARLRLDARNSALALLDSFVAHGHRAFALDQLPACAPAGSGYQNPNASWAAALDQWDPALQIDARGRLIASAAVPVNCSGSEPWTYRDLRDSLWDPHATAYRALVLADGYQQLRGLLPDERRRAWLLAIRQTGDALALPSGYEPGNNHGLTQSLALLELAHDFAGADPELLPAAVTDAWLDLGRHRLNDLLVDTVYPDGVQVEQSPFYHDYQLALLLLAQNWLTRAGIDLAEQIDPAYAAGAGAVSPSARRDFDALDPAPADPDVNHLNPSSQLSADGVADGMVRAAIQIASPDGWIPMIGSSLPQHFSGYNAPALDLYVQRGGPLAQQLEFYRSAGAQGTPPPDADLLSVFADSGFVTLHSGFAPNFPRQTQVVFQAGMPRHRHAHADALSVFLFGPAAGADSASGRPLLIDPGWFSYRVPGRHYFESTLAHNTVNVDGRNQCLGDPSGKRASPYVDRPLSACADLGRVGAPSSAEAAPGTAELGLSARGRLGATPWLYQSARHGLYPGVTHRRGVLLLGAEVLIVFDDLTSERPHTFSQTWHLPPDIAETAAEMPAGSTEQDLVFADTAAGDTPLFSLHEAGGPDLQLIPHRGEPAVAGVPGSGWYSTAEEQLEPSLAVEFVQSGSTRARFASVFLLGELAGRQAQALWHPEGTDSLALSIVFEDGQLDLSASALGSGPPAERFDLNASGSPATVRVPQKR